jgi:Ni,Fe-hydrogenase III component G
MSTTKHPELDADLAELTDKKEGVYWTTDVYGNEYGWYRLLTPKLLSGAAGRLAAEGARLVMITAYSKEHLTDPVQEVAYHFEVGKGAMYTLTVALDQRRPAVASITPLFPNADWHEREMRELYNVQVDGHPNPNRLFLDEEIEEGILGEAVPLSIMMNGACTTDLWERILEARARTEQKSAQRKEAGA